MHPAAREDWLRPPNLTSAAEAQRQIAVKGETHDRLEDVRIVAGADTSMKWRDSRGPIHAAIAPMAWPGRDVLAPSSATLVPAIPYIPGYLGFREVPALLAAWEALPSKPDLIIVDGHGRAHPRRCGIATHLGVVLDMPSIGCAKSLLCGEVQGEIGPNAGDAAPLVHRGEQIGVALRLRPRALPVYISIGHRISLESAVDWIVRLSDGRRLPPPIRLAHDAANAARRAAALAVPQ